MLIEVSEIHPPRIGGKVSKIVAADGQHYEIWPDKLAGIAVGKRYDVEIAERQYNGRTIKSIQKITPAPAPDGKSETYRHEAGNLSSHASLSSGEAEYIGRVLAALIMKGEVTVNQVPAYTMRLREVWRQQ
jgi:hypothetical protein